LVASTSPVILASYADQDNATYLNRLTAYPADSSYPTIENMNVDHGRFDVAMAQEFL